MDAAAVGLDFGTTNSSIALVRADGNVEVARFAFAGAATESFRSLLYLERAREGHRRTIKSWSGPQGIERYLDAEEKGRLIQSLKSFLSSGSLRTTEIFGRSFTLEQLIANILRDIRTQAEEQFGGPIQRAVVGRPIRFVGAETAEDDEYAVFRLRQALTDSGFQHVVFEFEPVAAAYHYESKLDRSEVILIGDFGGGTSDFSLVHVGPEFRTRKRQQERVMGSEGVPLAGDAFDARLIRHLVSPALGAGTVWNSGSKILPIPNWVYFKLERWHHLSFLRSAETMAMLRGLAAQGREPEKLHALVYLVQHDLGYQLHQAVQRAKVTLSHAERTVFRFSHGEIDVQAEVTRAQFETWIAGELHAIEKAVTALLSKTGMAASRIDRVFLTGGTSLVPAVRRIFESRFGSETIRTGDEFTSVARGLAIRAASAS